MDNIITGIMVVVSMAGFAYFIYTRIEKAKANRTGKRDKQPTVPDVPE